MKSIDKIIIVYLLTLTVYGILEIIFQRKFSKWSSKKIDKGFVLIVLPFYLSIYLTPVEYILLKPQIIPAMLIIGYIILCLGIIVRIVGLQTLKNNFSIAIETQNDAKLVTTGIYKYIRHPLYLSVLLMSVGASIYFFVIFSWIFVLLNIVGLIYRINQEEKFLNQHFPDYPDYCKKTKRMIPLIY